MANIEGFHLPTNAVRASVVKVINFCFFKMSVTKYRYCCFSFSMLSSCLHNFAYVMLQHRSQITSILPLEIVFVKTHISNI